MNKQTRYYRSFLIIILFTALHCAGCIDSHPLTSLSESSDLVEESQKVTNNQHEGTPTPGISIPDNEEIPLRGIYFDPGQIKMQYEQIPYFQELRNLGINSVEIVHWIEIDVDTGDVFDDIRTQPKEILEWIDLAHQAGLHVYLQLYPEYFSHKYFLEFGDVGPYKDHGDVNFKMGDYVWRGELLQGQVKDKEKFYQDYTRIALKWAKEAELHGVELYSPVCELHNFLGLENNTLWLHENLLRLRNVYHGQLVQKGEIEWEKFGLDNEGDLTYWVDVMTGWDYINADIFGGKATLEEYSQFLDNMLVRFEELQAKTGIKGVIIGEVGIPEDSPVVKEKVVSSREIRIAYWTIFFKKMTGHVDGMYFWGWEDRSSPLVVTSFGKTPYSQNELEGPLSLVTLNYKETDEARQSAYSSIHQLKWLVAEIEHLQMNIDQPITNWQMIEEDLKSVSKSYSQGDFVSAKQNADNAIMNAQKIKEGLMVEVELAQITESIELIKAAGVDSWISESQINELSVSAMDLLSSGEFDDALKTAKEAHRLSGMVWNDPQGDVTDPNLDLRRVLFSEKNGELLLVIETQKTAENITIHTDIDLNFDREKENMFYAKREKSGSSEISNVHGNWKDNYLILYGTTFPKPFAFRVYIINPELGDRAEPMDVSSPEWIKIE